MTIFKAIFYVLGCIAFLRVILMPGVPPELHQWLTYHRAFTRQKALGISDEEANRTAVKVAY